MKRQFLLSTALVFGLLSNGFAQNCVVDSAALGGPLPIYPAPETPDNPSGGINIPACVGKPFEFTLTFAIPDTIVSPTIPFPVPLNGVALATTGGITGAPAWMSYSCGPANCVFPKNTLGCLKLFGTPPPGTPDSDVNLFINVTVSTIIGPIALTLPGGTLNIPGNYTLRTRQANDPLCTVSTFNFSSVVRQAAVSPNPATGLSKLRVEALSTEKVQLEIIDLFGRVVFSRPEMLVAGENALDLPTYVLPSGNYVYRLSNQKGRMAGKFLVQ